MSIIKKIKSKKFSPLYLLYGTESFLINEVKQKLMSNVLTNDESEFNYSAYDLEETPVELVIEDAETYPFMGEKKLIIVHNPVFLTAVKPKEKVEHNLKKLEEYLTNPAPYTVMAFTANYEKLDERKKITKLIKKHAEVLEAKPLNEVQLKNWIKDRAVLYNVEIEDPAIETLLFMAGGDLMVLNEELIKLSLYVGEGGSITEETVKSLISRSLEQNVFSLTENVVKRKSDEVLRIYYDLMKQNEEPIKILSLIAGQFRLIYQVKELTGRGYNQKHVAGMLKVHPYRVKLAAGQGNSFSNEELKAIIHLIAECDITLKTGGLDRSVAVELLLMKILKK
ncbi:DNA polymerase III subunit delta [Siminovitchia acidinfaciens]|uniref:DNA polymerase III subunit delta n=1 Tax=Siminovitchia acidinfaciens TaxID=2321395 RepID=UPI001F188287|nr:DNA polymerase III subunit delta [Siminovitchia acidinfaciens]